MSETQKQQPRSGVMMGRRSMVKEKPKHFKKTMKSLVKYCRPYMWAIIISLISAALGAVLTILGPDRIKDLTNAIEAGLPKLINGLPFASSIDMGVIWPIVIILICFYVSSFLLTFLEGWILATVSARLSKRMRGDIAKKINRLPFSYFNKTPYGDVLSRVTNDVDTIGSTLNQSIVTFVTSTAMLFGSLVMMFYTDWIMALTAIGSSLIGFVIMAVIMNMSQKHFSAQQKQLGALNGQIEEKYTGHNIVKVYNAGKESKQRFEAENEKLYKSGWKSQFFSGMMMPFMNFVGNLGYVAVCVVGGVLVIQNGLSFGVIIAFMMYVRLFNQPLGQFAQAASNMQRSVAAGERVFDFLDERELDDENKKTALLKNIKGAVEFKNIKFGYEPDKIIINDFSANIKAGQKIAIVGPTGAGKTTLVNLLMRFYGPDSGDILIDGTSIYSVPRENIHDQFCMVLQDTWIFEGTIKENIIYSKENVTDEQVIEACKAVGMHHFIQTLPSGYDTVLDDKAALSEGEKQLLTIARAVIKNAPLLILDEATSSVDTRTERKVQAAMDKLMEGRTSFVIAHRLSTIKNADIILVMKDGDIVESGRHKHLLENNGFYAELYNSQFEIV